MISPLPHANHIEYYINTKMQVEIPHDLKHDIECALYDYGIECTKTEKEEKDYWKALYYQTVDEYFKLKGTINCV